MMLIAPQSATEQVLEARAERLGVEIVYGAEVTALARTPTGWSVDVTALGTERAALRRRLRRRAQRGAAADRRRLRRQQYETHILLADVRLPEPPEEAMFARTSEEGVVIVRTVRRRLVPGRSPGTGCEQAPLDEPVTMAEIRDAFHRIAGTDFGMSEPRWSSRFLSEHRQARHYRVGRGVPRRRRRARPLAARRPGHEHRHRGRDEPGLEARRRPYTAGRPNWLLDSYEAERHPVGARC